MRRPLALALAAAALVAAGCSTSPCQTLGEKLCACTGNSSDTCKTQVENELTRLDPTQPVLDLCEKKLATCNAPDGAVFCSWIRTPDGLANCGLMPDPQPVTSTNP